MSRMPGLIICIIFILSNVGCALGQDSKKLIDSYVHAPDPGCCDKPEFFYGDIVALGSSAVDGLLKALTSDDPAYQKKRIGFIWMLGEIGDPRD